MRLSTDSGHPDFKHNAAKNYRVSLNGDAIDMRNVLVANEEEGYVVTLGVFNRTLGRERIMNRGAVKIERIP
jgi:hypothetical protein